jgi:hypothetical protein
MYLVDVTPAEKRRPGYRQITLDMNLKNRFGMTGEFPGFVLDESGLALPTSLPGDEVAVQEEKPTQTFIPFPLPPLPELSILVITDDEIMPLRETTIEEAIDAITIEENCHG